jgi:hypothetical protein
MLSHFSTCLGIRCAGTGGYQPSGSTDMKNWLHVYWTYPLCCTISKLNIKRRCPHIAYTDSSYHAYCKMVCGYEIWRWGRPYVLTLPLDMYNLNELSPGCSSGNENWICFPPTENPLTGICKQILGGQWMQRSRRNNSFLQPPQHKIGDPPWYERVAQFVWRLELYDRLAVSLTIAISLSTLWSSCDESNKMADPLT